MAKHVEMIISYTTDGSDFRYNDNHGVLTRCKDCEYLDRLMCKLRLESVAWHDFCSKAVRKDADNS